MGWAAKAVDDPEEALAPFKPRLAPSGLDMDGMELMDNDGLGERGQCDLGLDALCPGICWPQTTDSCEEGMNDSLFEESILGGTERPGGFLAHLPPACSPGSVTGNMGAHGAPQGEPH